MLQSLAIIIVNRDLKIDTTECIDSLIKAGATLQQIVVIDNGSKDDSVAFLRDRFGPELNQVEAQENFGYPYGLNLGIKFFLGKGPAWFLLMNNDTIVADDFLQALEEAIQTGKEYALFGPKILFYSLPETIWFMGAREIPGTMLLTNDHRGKKDRLDFPEFVPTDFVHGCAMVVRRDVIETIGFFDDTSPIYADDGDYSWRARKAGFRMAALPRVKIWHKVSAFMQKHKPKTRYLRIRNQIWFYRHYARGLQLPMLIVFTLCRSLWIGVSDLLHRQPELLSPLFWGWVDGWRGKGSREFTSSG